MARQMKLLSGPHHLVCRDRIMRAAGGTSEGSAVTEDEIGQVLTLLADPTFWTPFASVICVSAELPEP